MHLTLIISFDFSSTHFQNLTFYFFPQSFLYSLYEEIFVSNLQNHSKSNVVCSVQHCIQDFNSTTPNELHFALYLIQ
jgi:hypothetical protein